MQPVILTVNTPNHTKFMLIMLFTTHQLPSTHAHAHTIFSSKSDTDMKCDTIQAHITAAEDLGVMKNLKGEMILHQFKAEWGYQQLKEASALSRASVNVEVLLLTSNSDWQLQSFQWMWCFISIMCVLITSEFVTAAMRKVSCTVARDNILQSVNGNHLLSSKKFETTF